MFAIGFIVAMVLAAAVVGDAEIILPEIAAMAVALWAYREKGWVRQPEKIFIAPSATAVIGFSVNLLDIPYVAKLVLVLFLMAALLRLMKSNFAPSLATGVLPIVTNATHASFLIAIFATTLVLMLGVLVFRLNKGVPRNAPVNYRYMLVFLALHLIWIGVAVAAGYPQMAVIPPITVVVYESLQMPMYMAKMAMKQIAVLTLSATIGTLLYLNIDSWVLVAAFDMAIVYLILRVFSARIPAAYAFPLLPFVFPAESVPQLPYAAAVVSAFLFGLVLLFKTHERRRLVVQAA
ncbi:hypothetical protein PV773_18665 [Mesorhizobium sp. CC13]|uniref:hypothetical protein n=1 Tax=Mesorhizobium sp. CC13 TaxID=3029194 RepID=UPI0032643EB6